MINNILVFGSAFIMPILATLYAIIRKPDWFKQMEAPNWYTTHIVASVVGILVGVVAAYVQCFNKTISLPTTYEMYYAECFSVMGWACISCSFTDWKTTKIDRHMMRPLYIIQLILGLVYCWDVMKGSWIFAVAELAITVFCIMIPYIAIPSKKKDKTLDVLSEKLSQLNHAKAELKLTAPDKKIQLLNKINDLANEVKKARLENRTYHKIIPMGASDARLLAVIMASSFPMFTSNIIWPIIGFIVMGMFITVWFYSYSGVSTSYDSKGNVKIAKKNTFGAKRIMSQKSDSLRTQRIPLGPAITIPFLITSIIWLFF